MSGRNSIVNNTENRFILQFSNNVKEFSDEFFCIVFR